MNFCVDSFLWTKHWIHYFTPETKEQSKQWILLGEPALKKAKTVKSALKGDGHSFFGCTRYNSYRLPSVEANDQWRLLYSLIGPFQQHFKEKTSPLGEEESALPSRQYTCPARWPNSTNSTMNCFPIQHIRQI